MENTNKIKEALYSFCKCLGLGHSTTVAGLNVVVIELYDMYEIADSVVEEFSPERSEK